MLLLLTVRMLCQQDAAGVTELASVVCRVLTDPEAMVESTCTLDLLESMHRESVYLY